MPTVERLCPTTSTTSKIKRKWPTENRTASCDNYEQFNWSIKICIILKWQYSSSRMTMQNRHCNSLEITLFWMVLQVDFDIFKWPSNMPVLDNMTKRFESGNDLWRWLPNFAITNCIPLVAGLWIKREEDMRWDKCGTNLLWMQLNTAEDLGCSVWYFSRGIAVIAKHPTPTHQYIRAECKS